MRRTTRVYGALFGAMLLLVASRTCVAEDGAPPQYEFKTIKVAAARADEPRVERFSASLAAAHLDQGAVAWTGQHECISCHTNGTYMQIRPALTAHFGPPSSDVRKFFLAELDSSEKTPVEELKTSTNPARVIYLAAGFAEWDAHVAKKLSPETERALKLMFAIQLESGTWGTLDCWPPFESDAYHEATVAAMAAATAPGWLDSIRDDATKAGVARLKKYLRSTPPPHDYGRVLLLWASTRMTDLLSAEQRRELIDGVFRQQRSDGGWSIRTFATPEAWGGGNRAPKLRSEPDFATPASDGHQTGLAVVVLRSAGVEARDPRIQKGIGWLKANQRASGRWWTRSLNTDGPHFITYSGTGYPLLALSMCDALK